MTLRVDARTRAQWDALVCELKIARSGRTDVLAERLEVTAGTVVDWEAGRDMPTMFHLITWAHEVGFVLRVTERGGAPVRYQPYEPDVRDAWEVREMRGLALALHAVRLTERRSQGDVAAQLGVNRWSVSRWESGLGHPRPLGLLAWASALRCAVALRPVPHKKRTR